MMPSSDEPPAGRPASAAMELQPQPQPQPQSRPQSESQSQSAQFRRQSSSVSPVPPPTPSGAASLEPAGDYFGEPLAQAPTRLSQRTDARLSGIPTNESRPERPESRNSTRRPSIRIRRSSSNVGGLTSGMPPGASLPPSSSDGAQVQQPYQARGPSRGGNRPRSVSQPSLHSDNRDADAGAGAGARHSRRAPQAALPRLTEEGSRPTMQELGMVGSPLSPAASLPGGVNYDRDRDNSLDVPSETSQPGKRRRFSMIRWPGAGRRASQANNNYRQSREADEYDEELVDLLDTVDPEIQALSTLTNIQNSLFIPDLGSFVNRRPTYNLSQHDAQKLPVSRPGTQETGEPRFSGGGVPPRISETPEIPEATAEGVDEDEDEDEDGPPAPLRADDAPPMHRSNTITSRLTDSHYAALPHGVSLEGWTDNEKWELDDHVRHMLHSRRARFKRTMKGFGQYVRRPLGFFVTLYATLITLFGLAWVLFLIGWIYVGSDSKQEYTIHIIDSVLVALFAIMGDGLAPFRAVDSYHMFFVTKYWRIMEKAKKKKRLAVETSANEGEDSSEGKPAASAPADNTGSTRSKTAGGEGGDAGTDADRANGGANLLSADAMRGTLIKDEVIDLEVGAAELWPLTVKQQKSFLHHQRKLVKSHSFYKPHETFTHYEFPLKYLLAVIILLDCHSCLQISLGATTWGIDYHHRNVAITTTILCVSITCNICAGLVITLGDRKTRKKDVLKLLDRQELTSDAMKHMQHKKEKGQQAKATSPGEESPPIP